MPRLIFKCPYIKGKSKRAPAHLKNMVNYIATRDGAERIDPGNKNLPATEKQKELIEQLAREFPLSRGMFEYSDFTQSQTVIYYEVLKNQLKNEQKPSFQADSSKIQLKIHNRQCAKQHDREKRRYQHKANRPGFPGERQADHSDVAEQQDADYKHNHHHLVSGKRGRLPFMPFEVCGLEKGILIPFDAADGIAESQEALPALVVFHLSIPSSIRSSTIFSALLSTIIAP